MTLAFLSICTEGGNSVEEYLLPLLIPTFFYMYEWTQRWSNNQDISHSYLYAFLYGAILAFSFSTRLTNAMGICLGALIIAIIFVRQRRYKSLLSNILFFLIGFIVFVLPFASYFYTKGALDEMLYGSFFYNIGYTMHSSAGFDSIKSIISFLLAYASCIFLITVSIITILCNPQRKWSGFFWLIISGLNLLFFLNSFKYSHYAIITLPYLCVGIVELKYDLAKIRSYSLKKVIRFGMGCFYLFITLGFIHEINHVIKVHTDDNQILADCLMISKSIPEQEKNSFIAYNIDPSCYIQLGITPACRFFFNQDWLIRNNEDIKSKVVEAFEKSGAKWILVDTKIWNRDVRRILSTRYTIDHQYKNYTLLKLK